MTALQDYLRTEGNTPEKLKAELGIDFYEHPTLPLMGFKYGMIDSPKTHPIVMASRGTVLEKGTWKLVAQPFFRFFNWGEGPVEEMESFDWNDCYCNTKEDGSLCILYHYKDEWHVNTSGSFAKGQVNPLYKGTWEDLFFRTLDIHKLWDIDRKTQVYSPREYFNKFYGKLFDPYCTYIFELCSVYNKVIRYYETPEVYLLGINGINPVVEIYPFIVENTAKLLGIKCPQTYEFKSIKEVDDFLVSKELTDRTFEGIVLRDDSDRRFKVKNKAYLNLHQMHNNGKWSYKHVLSFIVRNDTEELLNYFPEAKDVVNEMKEKTDAEYAKLRSVWFNNWLIKDQKQFALAIVPATKFSGILFELRKEMKNKQTEEDLQRHWRNSEDLIIKVLFKNLVDKEEPVLRENS